MARLSLNKSTLSEQIKQLKTYRNFLPSLDLKRRQLLSEQEKARKELSRSWRPLRPDKLGNEEQDRKEFPAAASICLDMAYSAPGRMPLDLAMKLSVYNEDWYVQTPANAALKAMVKTTPQVLRIFRLRLRSQDCEEAIHAAEAIRDLAEKEPGLPGRMRTRLLRSPETICSSEHVCE
jgi:hypothetical protein